MASLFQYIPDISDSSDKDLKTNDKKEAQINYVSFGKKYSRPRKELHHTKTYMIDSLPAPSRITCKKYNGMHSVLQEEFFHYKEVQNTFDTIITEIKEMIKDGNMIITINVGCERGRHRSVAMVERLAAVIPGKVIHNDLYRKIFRQGIEKANRNQARDKKYATTE